MRPTDLERAEREVQLRHATRATVGVELLRARQRLEALELEYQDAHDAYTTAETKAAALRPVTATAVRTRLGVVA